jgi:hypothetical protein
MYTKLRSLLTNQQEDQLLTFLLGAGITTILFTIGGAN